MSWCGWHFAQTGTWASQPTIWAAHLSISCLLCSFQDDHSGSALVLISTWCYMFLQVLTYSQSISGQLVNNLPKGCYKKLRAKKTFGLCSMHSYKHNIHFWGVRWKAMWCPLHYLDYLCVERNGGWLFATCLCWSPVNWSCVLLCSKVNIKILDDFVYASTSAHV